MRKINIWISLLLISISLNGCGVPTVTGEKFAPINQELENKESVIQKPSDGLLVSEQETSMEQEITPSLEGDSKDQYQSIIVDGGDLSGYREPNTKVNIGYGSREYWAYTNDYGQLIKVTAKRIILQDDSSEGVLDNGRYYPDEAKVPGTERSDLDEGHVIADSLGGVSNAYNITPQNSTLNRHGDQAYMEKVIRDAGGCDDFVAIITYPDTKTQIPSHYSFTYTIFENIINDEFDNVDPDKANEALILSSSGSSDESSGESTDSKNDISSIDTNGNGIVTIAEAKAAGFKMPIVKSHWLYPYMTDGDGDGVVGE